MTALAGGATYPAARFGQPGSSISGTVVDFTDVAVTDFATRAVQTWPDGNTKMQTRVTLELPDSSRVSLYVKPGRMMRAVREAIKGSGAADIEQFGHLTVTFTGLEQGKGANPAKTYSATYRPFDPTVTQDTKVAA